MAKKAAEDKSLTRKAADKRVARTESDSGEAHLYQVENLNLFTIELQQDPELESSSEKTNFISVVVRLAVRSNNCDIGFVDIDVGRQTESPDGTKISASYLFVTKTLGSDIKPETKDAFLKHFAATTAWHKFRDIFSSLIGQAQLDFPQLPMSPPGVTLIDNQDQIASS